MATTVNTQCGPHQALLVIEPDQAQERDHRQDHGRGYLVGVSLDPRNSIQATMGMLIPAAITSKVRFGYWMVTSSHVMRLDRIVKMAPLATIRIPITTAICR